MRLFFIILLLSGFSLSAQTNTDMLYSIGNKPPVSKPYVVPDADSTKCIQWLINHGESPTTNDKNYLGQLIHELKGQRYPGISYTDTPLNVWDSISIYYPFMMSSSTAHSLNIKDTSNYTLSFIGSPIQSSSGASLNGSSQYALTGYNPLAAGNITTYSNSMGFYINGGTLGGSFPALGGISDSLNGVSGNIGIVMYYRNSGAIAYGGGGDVCNAAGASTVTGARTTPVYLIGSANGGFTQMSINGSTTYKSIHNPSSVCKILTCSTSLSLTIGGQNGCLTATGGSLLGSTLTNERVATFFFGRGLGTSQIKWIYDCMYNYNTVNLAR